MSEHAEGVDQEVVEMMYQEGSRVRKAFIYWETSVKLRNLRSLWGLSDNKGAEQTGG